MSNKLETHRPPDAVDTVIHEILEAFATTESSGAAMLRDPLGRKFVHELSRFVALNRDDIIMLSAHEMQSVFAKVPAIYQRFQRASYDISGMVNTTLARTRGEINRNPTIKPQPHPSRKDWSSLQLPE